MLYGILLPRLLYLHVVLWQTCLYISMLIVYIIHCV